MKVMSQHQRVIERTVVETDMTNFEKWTRKRTGDTIHWIPHDEYGPMDGLNGLIRRVRSNSTARALEDEYQKHITT